MIELTQKAAERILFQLSERGSGVGLRLAVRKSGCSGWAYQLDYAESIDETDAVFEHGGAQLVVAREHLDKLDGMTLDFRRDGLNQLFFFDNPNVTDQCGCGESFTVNAPSTSTLAKPA